MSEKKQQNLAEYIGCLRVLESQTSLLYSKIAAKVDYPLVKALLEQIALDSQKHSVLLKGIGESITQQKINEKKCAKNVETLQLTERLIDEVAEMQNISSEDLTRLSSILKTLESSMAEEYFIVIQMKTLEMLMKEINQMYNVDLASVKDIFMNIIYDEDRHTEILEKIKNLVVEKEPPSTDPFVKFQNPDAWSQPPRADF